MRSFIITALVLFAFSYPAAAQDTDSLRFGVKGFIDTYHALRSESPNDWMSSRTRVRGELTMEKGNSGAFLSTNLVYNSILKDRTGLQIREAYGYYSNEHWDIRAGRQIIVWGVADGLRLTDIISPMDYTEFLAQDYDDIRIPVGGLRARYSRQTWCLELVAIPVSSFFELPTGDSNPWSVGNLTIGDEPSRKLSNMEFGGRLSFFLSNMDFSLSALRTWNKMPEFVDGVGQYRRLTMLGGDFSLPAGRFVIRGEFAEYLAGTNSSNALLGLDWYAGNDWNLSAQYEHTYVSKGEHRNSGLATFRVSKDLLRNTLTLQSFAYVDVTNGGVYNRFSADYAVNDQLHAIIGYDLFHGDKGMFAIYRQNSEYWVKLKYSF